MKVNKTIKLFIDGKFPRTESGRSFDQLYYQSDKLYAHLCQASRKDFRNSIEAAKKAQPSWEARDAFNRSQILYRMAEMMEGKRQEFINLFKDVLGYTDSKAQKEFDLGRDAFVYYAGFCDKIGQVLGSLNPVSGPFHNFSHPSAQGVILFIASEKLDFERLCAGIASVIAPGNSTVVLLGSSYASVLGPLAETFATSDLPGGVINLLSGYLDELAPFMGGHREIDSILYDHDNKNILKDFELKGAENMKRVVKAGKENLCLERISSHVEMKTIWHPVGR